MAQSEYRDFYRIVRTNPATLWDFTSAKGRGQAVPSDPKLRDVWDGLSVYSTLSQARRKQRMSPVLGAFVVVLRIPTDGSIRFARTLGGDGHHAIWATPAELEALVVSVEPF